MIEKKKIFHNKAVAEKTISYALRYRHAILDARVEECLDDGFTLSLEGKIVVAFTFSENASEEQIIRVMLNITGYADAVYEFLFGVIPGFW